MAIIPGTTRFIGISPSVDLIERRSAQINAETEPYTMADIAATVGGGGAVATVVAGTNVTVDSTDPLNPIVNVPVVGAVATVVAGDGVYVDSTDPANPIVNAHKVLSGYFNESGGSLALVISRNDFDSTSPALVATKIAVGYWQLTFTSFSFAGNSWGTIYSFQPESANSTAAVGFYSAEQQNGNYIIISARDSTGAMADGLLNDVEFRMVQLS
jgi:hypothetical protein|tara:strand:+ start:4565 stop:5206 length:642 start_codon:yes stop_codon:yes gene_type:complete